MNPNRQPVHHALSSYGDAPCEESVTRLLEFVFCLYGVKYKEAKSLNRRINGLVSKTFSKFSKDSETIQAITLSRRISAKFCLSGASLLTWGEVRRLRNVLENFVMDIASSISGVPTNPYILAAQSFQFAKKWNKEVRRMEGQFLESFGDIYSCQLCIRNPQTMSLFLAKVRKAREVPSILAILHDKRNQKAISKSIEAYVEFQLRMISNP